MQPPEQDDVFDALLHHVMFAADTASIDAKRHGGHTPHVITTLAVREALKCALGNGLITVTPRDQWPEWIAVDPPYEPGAPW
jgi:hypothetical protein